MNPNVVVATNPNPEGRTSQNSPIFVEAFPAASGNVQYQEIYPTAATQQSTPAYGYPLPYNNPPNGVPAYPIPGGVMMPSNQQNLE